MKVTLSLSFTQFALSEKNGHFCAQKPLKVELNEMSEKTARRS